MSYTFLGFIIFLSTALGLRVNNYTTTCSCGWRNAPHLETKKPSIYGGTEALPGEWPYAVLIRIITGYRVGQCGGTIITKRHVLSATHCFLQMYKQLEIDYNVHRADGSNPFTYAQKVYINEKYTEAAYDISVLLTDKEFPFGQMIGPACFPSKRVPDGAPVVALGWGLTGNSLSNKLRMVEMVTKNVHQCKDSWPSININSYICTEMAGKSVCSGDSGGPLLYYDGGSQKYFLVGISANMLVTPGIKCPGITNRFTDVSLYKDWVIDKIHRDTNLELCTL